LLALGSAAGSLRASAQPANVSRPRRVGILLPATANEVLLAPFRKRMGELGWVEGRNLAIEVRNADNRFERLPALAADLVRLNVEVLVTASTTVTSAAKAATPSIPIVFTWVGDPVASGLVASLARPGGNLTGLSNLAFEIAPKQMELLSALIPGLNRIAELRDHKFQGNQLLSAQLRDATARAGIALVHVDASTAAELERAFAAAARERAMAMVVPPLPLYAGEARQIAQLAKKYRVPTASQFRSFVAAGGLVSYGSNLTDGFLRTATYVDRILRGARPADLPVEQADRFETVINRSTAAAFGITIPQSLLLRVDEVID